VTSDGATPLLEATVGELAARARALVPAGGRALLGLTGAPGAGKSTVAAALVAALGPEAVLVPMDGFHLADAELDRLGRRDRKGAPDTFDAAGLLHLLERLRDRTDDVVWAPVFRRELELAEAGALAVPQEAPLVVVEGNYLLGDGPFAPVRDLLTACWHLALDPAVRQHRLVARHEAHGRSAEQAQRWALGTDERNAALVESWRGRADLQVRVSG
jgi:pantothenate kinase